MTVQSSHNIRIGLQSGSSMELGLGEEVFEESP